MPARAVIIPIASTLVTSSYVNVPLTVRLPPILALLVTSRASVYVVAHRVPFAPRFNVPSLLGITFTYGVTRLVCKYNTSVSAFAELAVLLSANSKYIVAVVLSTVVQILPLDPFESGTPFRWLNARLQLPYPSLMVMATEPLPSPATICWELLFVPPSASAKKLRARKMLVDGLYFNLV